MRISGDGKRGRKAGIYIDISAFGFILQQQGCDILCFENCRGYQSNWAGGSVTDLETGELSRLDECTAIHISTRGLEGKYPAHEHRAT